MLYNFIDHHFFTKALLFVRNKARTGSPGFSGEAVWVEGLFNNNNKRYLAYLLSRLTSMAKKRNVYSGTPIISKNIPL